MSRIDPTISQFRTPARKPTADDLRRKAAARLAERLDPARTRHKPLSLLRVEARRAVEQYLEVEAPTLPKADRDKLVEEVLADAIGLGPLEELFRDEAVQEFMVLAHNQVIARKGENWLPTSVTFRDAEQYRGALAKMAAQGLPVLAAEPGKPVGAGLDVRLPNGFRVVAVLPPAVLDQPPLAVFTRGVAPTATAGGSGSLSGLSGGLSGSGVLTTPAPRSTVMRSPLPGGSVSDSAVAGRTRWSDGPATVRPSGTVAPPGVRAETPPPPAGPCDRLRQKITDRLTNKLAESGVYDVSHVPANELQKVIALYVDEYASADHLALDPTARSRLTLEILSGLRR
jgi:hypothetical protein